MSALVPIFAPVTTGAAVERAVVAFLTGADPVTGGNWLSTSIGRIEREEGLEPNSVQRPLSVLTTSQFEKGPEDQLPCVVVMSPGLTGAPERRGRGSLKFTWGVTVAGLVGDTTPESSRLMGQIYAAAFSVAIMEHRSLGGFASGVEQLDERYDDIDFGDGRTLGAGRCVFEVSVEDARRTGGGPERPLPPADPDGTGGPGTDPGDWPEIIERSFTVTPTPITEDVT